VKYAIKKGAKNYNKIAKVAAKHRYFKIVNYAFKMGANNCDVIEKIKQSIIRK